MWVVGVGWVECVGFFWFCGFGWFIAVALSGLLPFGIVPGLIVW